MVQLIASGLISQIGVNALNPVKEVSKTEKDQFCYCPEMEAEPVVEILEKKENAMIINVHVGFKKNLKKIQGVPKGFSSCLLFFLKFIASKKATEIDKIFTADLTFTTYVVSNRQ
jgi:hypothetical protein